MTKTEQVVQDVREMMENGETVQALHTLARYADHGVNNHTTEDILHTAIDEEFGETQASSTTASNEEL